MNPQQFPAFNPRKDSVEFYQTRGIWVGEASKLTEVLSTKILAILKSRHTSFR